MEDTFTDNGFRKSSGSLGPTSKVYDLENDHGPIVAGSIIGKGLSFTHHKGKIPEFTDCKLPILTHKKHHVDLTGHSS